MHLLSHIYKLTTTTDDVLARVARARLGDELASEVRALETRHANIPPTRKCNRRGVSFNPLKVGVRDARVSVEFEIQRHPALISSLTPASECHNESRGASKCTWSSSCPGPLSTEYERT